MTICHIVTLFSKRKQINKHNNKKFRNYTISTILFQKNSFLIVKVYKMGRRYASWVLMMASPIILLASAKYISGHFQDYAGSENKKMKENVLYTPEHIHQIKMESRMKDEMAAAQQQKKSL